MLELIGAGVAAYTVIKEFKESLKKKPTIANVVSSFEKLLKEMPEMKRIGKLEQARYEYTSEYPNLHGKGGHDCFELKPKGRMKPSKAKALEGALARFNSNHQMDCYVQTYDLIGPDYGIMCYSGVNGVNPEIVEVSKLLTNLKKENPAMKTVFGSVHNRMLSCAYISPPHTHTVKGIHFLIKAKGSVNPSKTEKVSKFMQKLSEMYPMNCKLKGIRDFIGKDYLFECTLEESATYTYHMLDLLP